MILALLRTAWAAASGFWNALPPKVKLAIIVAAFLAGCLLYHVYAVNAADRRGYARAHAECQKREDAAREAYERELAAAKQRNHDIEATHQAEMAVIGADYEKALQDSNDQRARDVAAARDGSIRLRVAAACPARGSPAAQTAASPAGSDAPGTAELPGPVAADLLGLADDADAVVRKLTACQAVAQSYYNACR